MPMVIGNEVTACWNSSDMRNVIPTIPMKVQSLHTEAYPEKKRES
ncbi:hypothetical protein YW5DRAFT_05971 [Streptomyces sp. Ncost-T6T-1]|nr:hypothetical protein YW5DRAFT_05971 [Streptomyces sp. Ncost-T6T-1]